MRQMYEIGFRLLGRAAGLLVIWAILRLLLSVFPLFRGMIQGNLFGDQSLTLVLVLNSALANLPTAFLCLAIQRHLVLQRPLLPRSLRDLRPLGRVWVLLALPGLVVTLLQSFVMSQVGLGSFTSFAFGFYGQLLQLGFVLLGLALALVLWPALPALATQTETGALPILRLWLGKGIWRLLGLALAGPLVIALAAFVLLQVAVISLTARFFGFSMAYIVFNNLPGLVALGLALVFGQAALFVSARRIDRGLDPSLRQAAVFD
ncbi:hypothetical protein [Stagnihabitans tardus]|uniref:Uncharacterized protein n=1 Tax=Stagnihabitans tardus TaxID=2699202 RepID=A0AAE4YA59_9RHOB|nr:hypothetical protein [Stagnihabitans tardus]NBZ86290.1 hypothetical protein [Stagnihabitans tardus]